MFPINHTKSYLNTDTSDLIFPVGTQGRIAKARSVFADSETRLQTRNCLETRGQDCDNGIRKEVLRALPRCAVDALASARCSPRK